MEKAIHRVFKYLEYKGIRHTRFEKEISLSNGYLNTQLKRNSGIGEDLLTKIVNNCQDLNPIWLLTGDGSMIISNSDYAAEPMTSYRKTKSINYDNQYIPLYNMEASAGLVELFQSQNSATPIDTIKIPNLPSCDGAVFVTGDSMYPLLKSGDIVAYKQINDYINDIFYGEMYLVSVGFEDELFVSVKYIQKSDEGKEWIKLVSHNQHHQDKDIHLSKVKAMALVRATIRLNSMG